MDGEHRTCRGVIRNSPRGAGVCAEEVVLGRPEQHLVAAAGEPLSYPEYALWVIDGTAERVHPRRHGAYPAGRHRQPLSCADDLGILLEHARAEKVPLPRYARRRKLVAGSGAYRADAEPPGDRFCPARNLAPKAAGALNDAQFARRAALAGDMPQERLRVQARWRQHGDDMAGVRPFNVVARTAVIPYQPARLGGHAPGRAHQLCGVRPEQEVAARGHARQDRFKRAPVAAVIFRQQVRCAIQRAPGFKPAQGRAAELCVFP